MIQIVSALLTALVLLHATLAAAQAPSGQRIPPQPIDRIIAVVNDEAITESELAPRTQFVLAQLRRQNIAPPPPAVLRRQVLERLIVDRAQIQTVFIILEPVC